MALMKSSKPKKQRKQHYTMQLHKRQKAFAAHLSKELRKELGRRSLEIRKDDKVKVMRGKHTGKTGKVVDVRRKKIQVFIEKITVKKTDGREVGIPFRPSNLLLIEVARDDKERVKGKSMAKENKETAKSGKEASKKEAEKKETVKSTDKKEKK
jgi:large subunit ribosomal protein L24